jgi:hypothetical protein
MYEYIRTHARTYIHTYIQHIRTYHTYVGNNEEWLGGPERSGGVGARNGPPTVPGVGRNGVGLVWACTERRRLRSLARNGPGMAQMRRYDVIAGTI